MEDIILLKKKIFDSNTYSKIATLQKKDHSLDDILTNKDIDTGKFSLAEVLESLSRTDAKKNAFIFNDTTAQIDHLKDSLLFFSSDIDPNNAPNLLLYEYQQGIYYIYKTIKKEKKEKNKPNYIYSFIPTGITVRRVPQNTLGIGILGRAFIHSDYIEILDSLIGEDYMEVLTHEILHIKHPYFNETKIRNITKQYHPNARYN